MIKYLLNIVLSISLISCLRWNSSGIPDLLDSPIFLSMTSANPAIDIYKGDQIIIFKDIGHYTNQFTVYCMVAGYTKSDLVYRFCKENKCSPEWKESDPISEMGLFNFPKISKKMNFPDRKGLILKLTFPGERVDMSGNFHCEVEDSIGKFMIRSNNIQIRDIHYWSQNYVTNPENKKTVYQKTVSRDVVPTTFKCADGTLLLNPQIPKWFDQLSISPVEWSVCPVKNNYNLLTVQEKMTYTICKEHTTQIWNKDKTIEPRQLSKMTQWNQYVDHNGDLQIFRIDFESTPSPVTYALMCYIKVDGKARPINTYVSSYQKDDIISGVNFNGSSPPYKKPLTAISPITQYVKLYIRKSIKDHSTKAIYLIAQYRASPSAKAYWKFNGHQLNTGTNIKFNEYSVQFVGDITPEMAGNYTLDITDGVDKLIMTIITEIAGPPTLTTPDCLPLVRYVMEFDSTTFTCTYRNRPQSLSLKINNVEIALSRLLDISRLALGNSYPYLTQLNFTVSPIGYIESDVITMTYSIHNLKRTQGQTLYQDHIVMFFVKNQLGMSVKGSSIYVVPRLKNFIYSSPELCNCTEACSSSDTHKFQCKIQVKEYMNKELIIDRYWTINNHRLERRKDPNNYFAPYFTVDSKTNELILHPVESNNTERDNFVKNALKDNFIECHFDLISSPEIVPKFIYYSQDDSSLKNTLKAKIKLDYQPINAAYMYWIVAVILIFLVVLLIILTRYFKQNNGETYQIGKIEMKHGYDPVKELKEELFNEYERKEIDQSINSAEDGECNDYDLDPCNSNENVKNGTNTRNRSAMT